MRSLIAVTLVVGVLVPGVGQVGRATESSAEPRLSCAADPDELTDPQMIRRHTTGNKGYPVMFLGKVVRFKDVGGKPGGRTIAKLAVAEHPVGFAPLVSRVRFERPQDGQGWIAGQFEFERRGLYVVVADRMPDGSFAIQLLCGDTHKVRKQRFHSLIRMARN